MASELHLCFTHLEMVVGDNMPSEGDKAIHVLNSGGTVLTSIGKELGRFAERPLRARIRDNSYFLADAHRRLTADDTNESVRHMARLVEQLAAASARPALTSTRPEYEHSILMVAIRDATYNFHRYWRALLGLGTVMGVDKEIGRGSRP